MSSIVSDIFCTITVCLKLCCFYDFCMRVYIFLFNRFEKLTWACVYVVYWISALNKTLNWIVLNVFNVWYNDGLHRTRKPTFSVFLWDRQWWTLPDTTCTMYITRIYILFPFGGLVLSIVSVYRWNIHDRNLKFVP